MKLYAKEKFDTEEEWLSARGFGGSSASALFGLNPYMNEMDIYLSCVFPKERENQSNKTASTRYGHRCESIIANLTGLNLEKAFNVKPTKGYEMYHRVDKPYMTATLDGVMTEKATGKKYILEIKTHDVQSKADFDAWNNKKIPMNYFIQCCHYMAVLNDYEGVFLVAKLRWIDYDTGLPRTAKDGMGEAIFYYRLERDKYTNDIELVEETETKFYNEHIKTRTPPDVDLPILEKGGLNGDTETNQVE